MKTRRLLLLIWLGAVCAGVAAAPPAALRLVIDGKSGYAIYCDPGAPSSVRMASAELQTYLEKVTGARLPLVTEPAQPMVCLGANSASAAAGLRTGDLAWDGWRLAVRGPNLFLLGRDTAEGERTPQGGTSSGTRNAVYTFIERFLGVRWLMPGPHGDFVPHRSSLEIPGDDLQGEPFFLNRRVPYTQEDRPETRRWWLRQKLGFSLFLNHSHNWDAIAPERYAEHPDWFAESGGARVPPAGRYKLCTSSPGLIRAFAAAAIAHFDAHPQDTCFSLSPSDSGGWCECATCRAQCEKDPYGELSVTPAVLRFYNEVAKRVAGKYPHKVLAGYIYAQYVYPPAKRFELAPNLFLVWAPSFDYGFTLHRPELRKRWEDLAAQWSGVTRNIAYYDLPNCVHNELGAINPPGLEILAFLYPRLRKYGFKGVYVYGNPAWGYAGPMNYLLARLAWDPAANVHALFREYIQACYAEGAPEMEQFHQLLEAETKRYFLSNESESYHLSNDRLREVYGRNFPELERLYRAAEAKITDSPAAARLAMLGEYLTVLHWNLRQAKLLADPAGSSFYRPDRDFFAFVKANARSLALAPAAVPARPAGLDERYAAAPATSLPLQPAAPLGPFLLRGAQRILLVPTGTGQPEVSFRRLTSRGGMVTCQVWNAQGDLAHQGVLSTEMPVILPTGPGPFTMLVAEGSHSFTLAVKNAAWAVSTRSDDKGLHLLGKATALRFEVPAGVSEFPLWLASDAPGETVAGSLYEPGGRKVAHFDTSRRAVDLQTIAAGPERAGWWTLLFEPPASGAIDDAWIKLGEPLTGFVSFDPAAALSVRRKK